jgi:WD40 repeat protein
VVIGDANSGMMQVFSRTLTLIKTLKAHNQSILRLKNLPNGYIASASADFTVKIWNITDSNWSVIQTYTYHTGVVYDLEYIDELTIASSSADKTIHIWNITSGETKLVLNAGDEVTCLKLLPIEGFLLSGQSNGSIYAWNIETRSLNSSYVKKHTDRVTDLALMANETLASSSWDATILIWNLTTQQVIYILIGHTNKVMSLKVLSSSLIASGSMDNTSKIWDLNVGNVTLESHTDSIMYSVDMFSEDILMTASLDRTIKFWDLSSGTLCRTHNVSIRVNALIMTSISGEFCYFCLKILYFLT